ncbi:hypothetical protein EST38_g11583 [Candolleomyces aberdarensis]|uniref:Uncharacterized protein n=1 Tax=Candolleomyces aberdarensis TaxID=2316362 RepID=A0A4Q2D778_9AGAR|nr:hypothetical protein EST38_g11583 [Candolleomyces aberdarensis]
MLVTKANSNGVLIISPATVGGNKPGYSGGMMDNTIASKLYHPSSVGYVSKLGGMSNDLNILSIVTNGTYEGIAIGGMLVLLGEAGGIEREAIRKKAHRRLGHRMANSNLETTDAKNRVMRDAGFVVPDTFEEPPRVHKGTYESLTLVPKRELSPPLSSTASGRSSVSSESQLPSFHLW